MDRLLVDISTGMEMPPRFMVAGPSKPKGCSLSSCCLGWSSSSMAPATNLATLRLEETSCCAISPIWSMEHFPMSREMRRGREMEGARALLVDLAMVVGL